jgi:hypothetical protein
MPAKFSNIFFNVGVAALAGISLPWYTSLEQGRDINVSDQVLDSLARVLRLDRDEHNHLGVQPKGGGMQTRGFDLAGNIVENAGTGFA